jgi:hypothetical protein
MQKSQNDIIYHYTSPEGLKAILESHSLRFTNYRFLNDKNEGSCERNGIIKKLVSLFTEENKKNNQKGKDFFSLLTRELIGKDIKDIVNSAINNGKKIDDSFINKSSDGNYYETKNGYYVLSLSKEKDSLSMWNYYMKNRKYEGYNIGFDVKILQEIFSKFATKYKDKSIKFENKNINYINKEEENSEFENIVLNFKEQYVKTREGKTDIVFKCRDKILLDYIFSKDDCFRHEDEYRFVLIKDQMSEIKEKFYIKNGIITPYIDVPLNKEDILKAIKFITISPLLEEEIANKGLEFFLMNIGYKLYDKEKQTGIIIKKSKCPIRY